MDIEAIKKHAYEQICHYDPRSEDYDSENRERTEPCFCDNCFYGRHKMAEQIIYLIGIIEIRP